MKIVVDDEFAYVHLKGNRFLQIGKKKEVLRADPLKQAEMFQIAMAFHVFNDIEVGRGHTLH